MTCQKLSFFFNHSIDFCVKKPYNNIMDTTVTNVLISDEVYTHEYWEYRDVFVQFSRLYYILDGEAYYHEGGRTVRFLKNHLYLTPVKRKFSLTENPQDKLLHTYAHIHTIPPITQFMEIEVKPNTCLYDAVMLWRKHASSGDHEELAHIINLILSCIPMTKKGDDGIASSIKSYIDEYPRYDLTMKKIAERVGYSTVHVNRIFIEKYKIAPIKYYNNRRLSVGLKMLLGGICVKEVSLQLNYASPAAFSKAFKLQYGLSPLKYLLTIQSPKKNVVNG